MIKKVLMESSLAYVLFKRFLNKETITPSLIVSALVVFLLGSALFLMQLVSPSSASAAGPNWDVTDSYVVSFDGYEHDMTLTQNDSGEVTGNGGYEAGEPYTYAWTVTEGSVDGDTITMTAEYTLGATGTTMHMVGTIAGDGSMSGTWDDNYGGARTGSWSTVSGNATMLPGSLAAADFGVVDYDSGLGILRGYTAGFSLTDATFEDVQSVVVKLYSGATLLQTNTATSKVGDDITGADISSPFDVSGTFDYGTDGYWVNERESEYGQSMPATKVVATVVLENGKVVTAENTNLTGDPTTIYPPVTTGDVQVTIVKFVNGAPATGETADNADFPMSATWDAENIGAGTGEYALSETGFNGDPTPYRAVTSEMTSGADYSTNEILNGPVVGANCDMDKPFALVGYTTGNTYEAAMSGTPTTTSPSFTNLTTDKTVIVWNIDCSEPNPDETVQVTVIKFIDGKMATSGSADNSAFPMRAAWETTNIGAGSADFSLANTGVTPYQVTTVPMNKGADYEVKELVNGQVVGAQCATGKPFALRGYTTGSTFAQAASATPGMAKPSFDNLQTDKYVIVWNKDCSATSTSGQIGGEVEGSDVMLEVTSIDAIDTSATANGSFTDGWKYRFHITAPTDEENLAMKFSNWLRTGGNGTIPVANNMRISSAQADNGGATILLTAPDTYSTPALHMVSDVDPLTDGRQVEILVEVAIPAGTPSGAYTTNYGVQSNP